MSALVDIAVYGAGIVGSLIVREARNRGLEVALIDPYPQAAASRAALAVIRQSWHHDIAEKVSVQNGLAMYAANGWIAGSGATVTHYRHPGTRFDPDYFLIDPIAPLVTPSPPDPVTSRWTVVANGRTTKDGVAKWGFTAVGPATAGADGEIWVRHLAPYHSLVCGRIQGELRVGSSTHTRRATAEKQCRDMVAIAQAQGMVPRKWKYHMIGGIRYFGPPGRPGKPEWVGQNTVVVGGFGKVGYALAPARAREVIDHICA